MNRLDQILLENAGLSINNMNVNTGATTDDILVFEQALIEEIGLDTLCEAIENEDPVIEELLDTGELVEESLHRILEAKKTIIRFNKEDSIKRAKAQKILQKARDAGDIDYKNLQKAWERKDFYWSKLVTKYGNKAESEARREVGKAKNVKEKITDKAQNVVIKKTPKTDSPTNKRK